MANTAIVHINHCNLFYKGKLVGLINNRMFKKGIGALFLRILNIWKGKLFGFWNHYYLKGELAGFFNHSIFLQKGHCMVSLKDRQNITAFL